MDINDYIGDINKLCKQHNVKTLFVFGSILTGKFKPESDIDFIVDINSTDPIEYAENYFDLKFKLQDLLKKPIDLLEQKGLRNTYLIQNINSNKRILYEA
ncbi:MAG: nucleotidyltransferase domain-containing protein [Prolixibacteraceae bacterium]|nr:nucleotidyltransferase domain-containing protein [Prolixibacteraceae bacterium]